MSMLFRESRWLYLCPLPLRERAARKFNEEEWVRGTPHPAESVEMSELPSPSKRAFTPVFGGLWGEGAATATAARGY
jgi:hypothetical protein